MEGIVFCNGIKAGILKKINSSCYTFNYHKEYLENKDNPPISLTLPKSTSEFQSAVLFPFFYGLLSEGVNKEIQCRLLKIDEHDDFTRLLLTAGEDTIGAVTIKQI